MIINKWIQPCNHRYKISKRNIFQFVSFPCALSLLITPPSAALAPKPPQVCFVSLQIRCNCFGLNFSELSKYYLRRLCHFPFPLACMSILVVPLIVSSYYCQSFFILVILASVFLCTFNSKTSQKLKGLIQVIKKLIKSLQMTPTILPLHICACYSFYQEIQLIFSPL